MAEQTVPDEAVVRRLVERAGASAEAGRGVSPSTVPVATTAASGAEPPPSGAPTSIAIGADHGGVALKEVVAQHLSERGFGVTDCGTTGTDVVDYPDFAHVVARLVATGACSSGIVIDGAGIGSAIA